MKQPGDYVVIHYHQQGIAARVIGWVTRSRWTHAATYLGDGLVGEATRHGYIISPLAGYFETADLAWSTFTATPEQRATIVTICRTYADVNVAYGYTDLIAIGLHRFGIRPHAVRRRLRDQRHLFCSQAIAASTETAGIEITPNDWWTVTPADLAHAAGRDD